MRTQLFYNPFLLAERIGEAFVKRRRFAMLKGTAARYLRESQIDSLEFLQFAKKRHQIKTIYDVGANVGSWTLLAKSIIPQSTVHAFEPLEDFQEQYLENTKNVQNVFLHKTALGNETRNGTMNMAGHSSSFYTLGKIIEHYNVGKSTNVKMSRLDEYVLNNNIRYPDLMKLDVEGFELEVLKSANICMDKCKYIILEVSFVERHVGQPLFAEVTHFLSQHNYKIGAFCVTMPRGQEIISTDVLFIKE